MRQFEVLGKTMWECNPLTARRIWREHPEDRWRIVSHAEYDAHILDDPAQVEAWISRKIAKPGQYLD